MKFPKERQAGKQLTQKQRARKDQKHASKIREEVASRDGGCRFPVAAQPECDGPVEFAHLPNWRRSRTMGQAPEDRHTMEGSMMLCRRHHTMLDQNKLVIATSPTKGANASIRWFLVLGNS